MGELSNRAVSMKWAIQGRSNRGNQYNASNERNGKMEGMGAVTVKKNGGTENIISA